MKQTVQKEELEQVEQSAGHVIQDDPESIYPLMQEVHTEEEVHPKHGEVHATATVTPLS